MERYEKKITADWGYLRPVQADCFLMRIIGRATEGWAETSPLGGYVRWSGNFRADVPPAPDQNGEIKGSDFDVIASDRLILPAVVAQWLAGYFEPATVPAEAKLDPLDTASRNRTGLRFSPKKECSQGGVVFAIELVLRPAKPGKPTTTGYEYGMNILAKDNRFDPWGGDMAALLERLPALLPGPQADTGPQEREEQQAAE